MPSDLLLNKVGNKNSLHAVADPIHAGSGSDQLQNLLVASGLSASEGARELGVDEKTLLYWCQPNGKLVPPRWAIRVLSRLVTMRKKARDL